MAIDKQDTRIMALVSRELVAAEACYHKSCYRDYTRPKVPTSTNYSSVKTDDPEPTDQQYTQLEQEAYGLLFKDIRFDILENPRLVKMSELLNTLVSYMQSLGVKEIKNSTKTHRRRKLEKEFGELLEFEDLLDNSRLFVIPYNLSKVELAKSVARMAENEKNTSVSSKIEDIKQTAVTIRQSILSRECDMSWPPQPTELNENNVNIPEELVVFLSTLLTGNKDCDEANTPQRLQRLITSFGQDLIFGVSGGRQKPPKHILLPHAVKTLTNNVDLIQILNRCGHGVSYSQIEELNTALWLQKLSRVSQNEVPMPGNIIPHINTTLAWDNIDRLEETLSGEGTSHRVNGIAIQTKMFGPHLPPQPIPEVVKSKKRSLDCLTIPELPVYNAGERCGKKVY